MDTSEKYIKMCDCSEVKDMIQKIIETDHKRKVETHRRFADTKYNVRIPDIRTPDVSVYDEDGSPMRRIDLLSQDQIQEMVDGSWVIAFESFHEWYFSRCYPREMYPNDYFESMEQLWLAFYMHEKHEKIWNGKEWEKKV